MREQFQDIDFTDRSMQMIGLINGILDEYADAGYDLSLRQLYYQLVSRNVVENTERSYKSIGDLVSNARLGGMIDWEMIKDRGRETVRNPHWDGPADIIESCAREFRIDLWKNQPNYVEVMVEKQALEGVLIPVCREYDVPFTANKGYSSSSAMYEASKRFAQALDDGKFCYVLYLGDHDPSGIDMSRDVLARLSMFVRSDDDIEVQRLALNMEQVRKLNPPENPAKLTDSRAREYVSRFGESSWELDAIEPKELASIVTKAIRRLIDHDQWDESQDRQLAGRKKLEEVAEYCRSEDEESK